MRLILKILFSALLAFILARYLPGVHIDSFWTAVVFAVVLSLLNFIVKPILVILTLPITVLTLGLFLIVINSVMVWMASGMIEGFSIDSFGSAFLFSILYSFISFVLFSGSKKEA